jgi:hypothetical protein
LTLMMKLLKKYPMMPEASSRNVFIKIWGKLHVNKISKVMKGLQQNNQGHIDTLFIFFLVLVTFDEMMYLVGFL